MNVYIEQPKPVFKIGDVVCTKNNSVGYISCIEYGSRYEYYYWTPIVVSFKDRNKPVPLEIGKETGLTYPYGVYYKRVGSYAASDSDCIKEKEITMENTTKYLDVTMPISLTELFYSICDKVITTETILDYIDGKKYEMIAKAEADNQPIFPNGTFIAYKWARDADVIKRLKGVGCNIIGITKNTDEPQLVGFIRNESSSFTGVVTVDTLNYKNEYVDYIRNNASVLITF